MILVDTPPIGTFSDARVLARWADAAVLVARAGGSDRESLLRVKQQFGDDNTPILGTILTHWNPETGHSFESYYNYQANRD